MNRYFIQVYGRVQGVGFRYTAQYLASIYHLTGWVKNCDDGSVQMEVQGSGQAIDKFLLKIKSGNGFIRIDNMDFKSIPLIDDERSFKVKYY